MDTKCRKEKQRKKIGQLTEALMPEQASRSRYDLITACARTKYQGCTKKSKSPISDHLITSSILNDPFRSLGFRWRSGLSSRIEQLESASGKSCFLYDLSFDGDKLIENNSTMDHGRHSAF